MSSLIRTQIGLCKRRLQDAIEYARQVETAETLQDCEEQEVLEEIVDVCETAHRIREESSRITTLHQQWMDLMAIDSVEVGVYEDYKARLGDYMMKVKEANAVLEHLSQQFRLFVKIHQKLTKQPVTYPEFGDESATSIPPSVASSISHEMQSRLQFPSQSTTSQTNPFLAHSPPQASVDNRQRRAQPPPTSPPQATINSRQAPNIISIPVNLPTISLPTFDGDYVLFQPFMELFSSLIESQPINDIAKLHYLNASLKGEAKQLIQHLPLIASNYAVAVRTLRDNYGDTIRTRHHLLRALQDLPSVAYSKQTTQLHSFWTKASTIFQQLKNLDPECDNRTTADVITRKLPKRYIEKLFSGNTGRMFIASELLDSIHRLVQTDSLIGTLCSDNDSTAGNPERTTTMSTIQYGHSKKGHIAGSRRDHTNRGSPYIPSTPCAFCTSSSDFHRHALCPKYTTYHQRRERARQLRLCFGCLRTGHGTRNCDQARPCYHCHEMHHSALCNRRNREDQPTRSSYQNSNANATQPSSLAQRVTFPSSQSSNAGPNRYQQSRSNYSNNSQNERNRGGYRGFSRGSNGVNRGPPRRTQDQQQQRHVHFGNTNIAVSHFDDTAAEDSETPMDTANTYSTTICSNAFEAQPPKENFQSSTIQEVLPPTQPKALPVAMMATEITIENQQGEPVTVTAFFDSGSDRSYITEDLADKLQLQPSNNQLLQVTTFANPNGQTIHSKQFCVTFNIKHETMKLPLMAIPKITNSITTADITVEILHLLLKDEKAKLPRTTSQPEILIGLDCMHQLLGNTTSHILPNGTTLHRTNCGIIVTGTENRTPEEDLLELDPFVADAHTFINDSSVSSPLGILHANPEEEHAALRQLLEKFWSLESCGIFENPKTTEDEETAKFFEETTTRDAEGRYVCRWPYKDGKSSLPDNRSVAFFRLQSTLKRLARDPDLHQKYHKIIEEQLDRNFIEIVEDESSSNGIVHYLSHHPVIKNTSKSTKVRIVYDASARLNRSSPSLNTVLYTGESLIPQLLGVLMRIRAPEILISGDIEKAFLMLSLHHEDRDACRFLWTIPGNKHPTCFRFCRVPFGVKTSPYLLNAVIKKHLQSINTPIAQSIRRNLYVDNVFCGVNNVEEGIKFYKEAKKYFHDGCMNLTQFFSNSSTLDSELAKLEGKPAEEQSEQKILGVTWNKSKDVLSIKLPPRITQRITKRRILQHIASTYDPIGIIAPVILKGKIFFQKLWNESTDWDSRLSEEAILEWTKIEQFNSGEPIEINRKLFSTPTVREHIMELHIFGDASDSAFGTVAYIRRIRPLKIETSFVAAKGKVSTSLWFKGIQNHENQYLRTITYDIFS